MINQNLKNQVFKVIPERSFLMLHLKKTHRFFIYVGHIFSKIILQLRILIFYVRNIIFFSSPIKVRADNTFFKLYCKGKEALNYWLNLKNEEHIFILINKLLKPKMTFFDIGSGEGFYSLVAAKLVNDAKIYAFESDEKAVEIFKKNVAINNFSKNISIQNLKSFGNVGDFLKKSKINSIDVLRVNLNGKELHFFEGIKDILSNFSISVIVYNISGNATGKFGYHPVEILWLLKDSGYNFFKLDKEGNIAPRQFIDYEGELIAIKI